MNKNSIRYLLPHLSHLKHELAYKSKEREKLRRAEFSLEQLPYCLGATYWATNNLVASMNSIKKKAANEVPKEGGLLLSHNDRDIMAFIVDNFLDAARRTQNVLLNYISISLSLKNFPKSMNGFIKKIEYWENKIQNPIIQAINDYWNTHGRRLKDYRDLSQHFAVIASDARAFLGQDNEIYIFFVLPNNPEVKSASKTIYKSPYTHVLPYLLDELLALINLVFDVTILLSPKLINVTQPLQGYVFKPKASTNDSISGYKVPNINWLNDKMDQLLKILYKQKIIL